MITWDQAPRVHVAITDLGGLRWQRRRGEENEGGDNMHPTRGRVAAHGPPMEPSVHPVVKWSPRMRNLHGIAE